MKTDRLPRVLFALSILMFVFGLGVVAEHYNVFPLPWLKSAPLAFQKLLHRTGAVRVEVNDGAGRLGDLLGAAGVAATVVDDATLDVRVDGEGGHVLDLIRDGADDLGLALHALTTRRTSLDELFLDEPA